MEKRTDRRIAMTKRLLKESLTELLKKKDIYHISIRELCAGADVNRTTFYKHYGSQFDLLADMENDLLGFIKNTIEAHESRPDHIIRDVCRYLENDLEFTRLIINNNIDPAFPQKLFSLAPLKDVVFRKCENKRLGETESEYLYNFIIYGSYRTICVWLNKDRRESPDKLAELIIQRSSF